VEISQLQTIIKQESLIKKDFVVLVNQLKMQIAGLKREIAANKSTDDQLTTENPGHKNQCIELQGMTSCGGVQPFRPRLTLRKSPLWGDFNLI